MSNPPRIIASIDVGSNSIQLTIAAVSATAVSIIRREKSNARLANEIDASGYLSEKAIEAATHVVSEYVTVAKTQNAEVRIAGTAALRRACNRHLFTARVMADCGVFVKVIDGLDEARLIRAGVLFGLPDLETRSALCVDVGGGSTEISMGRGAQISMATSIAVGGLSVQRRLTSGGRVSGHAAKKAKRFLEKRFRDVVKPIRQFDFDYAVATGGTIQRLAKIVRQRRGRPDQSIDGMVLSSAEIEACCALIMAAKSPAERLDIPGMDPTRAEHLLGGALIFQSLGQHVGIENWTVSLSAMRTGVLVSPAW